MQAMVSEQGSLKLPQEGSMKFMVYLHLVCVFPLFVLVLEYGNNVFDFVFLDRVS